MVHTLTAQHIAKSFKQPTGSLVILENICMQFMQGRSYAIMGISGAGKSTLIHILAGLERPTHGSILFDEVDISLHGEKSQSAYLQKSIGLVFQTPHLIRELSVIENVMLPGMISGFDVRNIRERALQLLERVGLQQKIENMPASLSIGQQQRVALCRALFNQPAFLIADEPTGALDEKTGRIILELLLELQKQFDMGLIISTHDYALARQMDEIYEIEHARLVQKK